MRREPETREAAPGTIAAIRRRPPMYIGSTHELGLIQLLEGVLANALEEAFHGGATRIEVVRHSDGSLSVTDNGRGFVDRADPSGPRSRFLRALTGEAGGRLRPENEPKLAHARVPHLACVSALSEWMEVVTQSAQGRRQLRFERGTPTSGRSATSGDLLNENGTTVHWKPDASLLAVTHYRPDALRNRLRTLSFLIPGLQLTLRDEEAGTVLLFLAPGGLVEMVETLNTGRPPLHAPVYMSREWEGGRIEIAYQYSRAEETQILGFLNHRYMRFGGIPIRALERAVPEAASAYFQGASAPVENRGDPCSSRDAVAGLTAVVSIHHPRPECEGMTAENIGHLGLTSVVSEMVLSSLPEALERSIPLRESRYWKV